MGIVFKDGIAGCTEGNEFLQSLQKPEQSDAFVLLHLRCIQSSIIMLHKVPSQSGHGLLEYKQKKQLLLHLVNRLTKAATFTLKPMCSLNTIM